MRDIEFEGKPGKGWNKVKGNLQPLSEYIYANGNIVSRTNFKDHPTSGWTVVPGWKRKEYYHQDILGSTIMLTDHKGKVRESYAYDAFGVDYEGDFHRVNEFGYNGKRLDPAVKLYDYGFRDYKSMLGRFTTLDPIRDSHNWYVYVNNDPVNFIDPFGLCGVETEGTGTTVNPKEPTSLIQQLSMDIVEMTQQRLAARERITAAKKEIRLLKRERAHKIAILTKEAAITGLFAISGIVDPAQAIAEGLYYILPIIREIDDITSLIGEQKGKIALASSEIKSLSELIEMRKKQLGE